jgi:ABC-type transport system involved in cytochrome bd biosynthesis fused ATPase/permease subunit
VERRHCSGPFSGSRRHAVRSRLPAWTCLALVWGRSTGRSRGCHKTPPLVTGTLAENIALLGGDPARAVDALRAVGAEQLAAIAHTDVVGPAGRPLSGGERRQVSLARAFATDLPVLLLDEPTEGLDAEATAAVLVAITSLRGCRTVLVATHRPEVVAITDKIVRLEAPAVARELAAE